METAASNPRRRGSLLSMLLMVITLSVAAFELSERLMSSMESKEPRRRGFDADRKSVV